jgi:hypothetical protein
VLFPVGTTESLLLLSTQTGSGTHLTSYSMSSSLGVIRPGREVDHSPLSSGEVKRGGTILPLLHTFS